MVKIHDTSSSPSIHFVCSSFKDLPDLYLDDEEFDSSSSQFSTSKKPLPSIFHRVDLANSLLHSWSTPLSPFSMANPSCRFHSLAQRNESYCTSPAFAWCGAHLRTAKPSDLFSEGFAC